jgi:hypothetical protein
MHSGESYTHESPVTMYRCEEIKNICFAAQLKCTFHIPIALVCCQLNYDI